MLCEGFSKHNAVLLRVSADHVNLSRAKKNSAAIVPTLFYFDSARLALA